MKHRTIRGAIAYTSKKPERLDQPRGHESFIFTRHTDGKVTLRAHCEIEDPDPSVLRDVIYSLDERRKPMDCHVRLTVGDRFFGSGWFRFEDGFVECESYSPALGRVSQRVELKTPIDGFGTHPIVGDGYLLGQFDWSQTKARMLNLYLPSPDHRGATAPLLAPVSIKVELVGEETVTVKAGRFDARRFRFIDEGGAGFSSQHPPYEVWITADDDAIFLQGGVGGYMQTWYELVELER